MSPNDCGFCHGQPVQDARTWTDGKPRGPVACPRCGRTNVGRPVDRASDVVAAKRHETLDEQLDDRLEDDAA